MLRLPRRIFSAAVVAAATLCVQSPAANASSSPRIEAIRFWSFGDVTRVAIEINGEYQVSSDRLDSPPRFVFDLKGIRPPSPEKPGVRIFPVGDRLIRQIRIAETEPGVSRVVFDLEVPSEFSSTQLVNPDRLIIEVRAKAPGMPGDLTSRSRAGIRRVSDAPLMTESPIQARSSRRFEVADAPPLPPVPVTYLFSSMAWPKDIEEDTPLPGSTLMWDGVMRRSLSQAPPPSQTPPAAKSIPVQPVAKSIPVPNSPSRIEPARTNESSHSLVRVFGLKIHKVVIDAGHGGHDTGTIGPRGLMEKDLVLDVALRLGRLVEQRLGAEVVFTRSTDTFVPLEERTKIANDEKADLFISIHANSSPAPSATGVETYYFNFTSDQHSLDLATRENASSNSSIFELNDLLHKAVLNAKVEESRQFAQRVESSLYTMSARMNSGSRDRGVKKAPFVVLIGATMPSILAEIGFVSNPRDERLLRRADQRQKIAESLYKGLSGYATSLSHVQMAKVKDSGE
ncbi:MAG: N-acetylmuramoyl-L-alanine amidase [Bryobacteraceae bacterium]